ncbi:NAD(+) synthase [Metamycoplasma canadense]|uniref:NH(3)-dependent NAD(+) synthetase n=1 Tax=Metamycoplasma canadense TaxID=29554 RepID=A0A077LBR4_9BACT|nr:NAD(+) synthase [Metamycoplasma canadense]BAP39574.1 NH(3)-dependent NAD(+) synthetase [Metamycoplasma canadense]
MKNGWYNFDIKNKNEVLKYENLVKRIKKWIYKKVRNANSQGITLGISGGIDSCALALISYQLFKENAHFYYLKTKKDLENEKHIKKLNKLLNNSIKTINLTKEFNLFSKKFNLENNWIKANCKSRFFMNVLYTEAQKNNSLVLGTDNFNEYFLGYFTKWGDGACDLLPFANLFKSDIYKIAEILNAPHEIINKRPSANLIENQFDEDELGFSYEQFENYFKNKNLVSYEIIKKIEIQIKKTEHKRKMIPKGPKLI